MAKGRSAEDAIKLGRVIAKEINRDYPYPIELKFEKVYCPFLA